MKIHSARFLVFLTFLLGLATAASAAPQEASKDKPAKPEPRESKPLAVYRVEFAIHEVEAGKRVNTRTYGMLLREDKIGRVRTASSVPIPAKDNQIVYLDAGTNIDCELREQDGGVAIEVSFEVSDFVPARVEGQAAAPVRRSIRAQVAAVIAVEKATLLSSVDDAATKRVYQFEVTAFKIK